MSGEIHMKKYFTVAIVIAILFSHCLSMHVYSSDSVYVYAPDGRSLYIEASMAESYYNVGWYPVPVSYIYSEDSQVAVVPSNELESYIQCGWYIEPVVYIYSAEGDKYLIYRRELDVYLGYGYYSEPVMYIYDINGGKYLIRSCELDNYIAYGYYPQPVTVCWANGRQNIIFASDSESHYGLGWTDSTHAMSSVMVSADGKEVRVPFSEYDSYRSLGYTHKEPVIDISRPIIALTFDDGPGIYTPEIIETLVKYNSKATFFCIGNGARIYPETVKLCLERGMEIGNHTYSHPNITYLDVDEIKKQLEYTSKEIYYAAGVFPKVFRPPYGAVNDYISGYIDMPVMLWSVETYDWNVRNINLIVDSVISQVKDGDIIVMHDTAPITVDAVKQLVPTLVMAGFQLVTVSELAEYKSVSLSNGRIYSSFK